MAKNVVVKPLGLVLRKAGLVSSQEVQKALQEAPILPQCRIGEILAIRGLIHPQTADFFAEVWPIIFQATNTPTKIGDRNYSSANFVPSKSKKWANRTLKPLGQYLKAAHLIDDKQIEHILAIQQHNSSKFGKIAVEQGIISQITLEFFVSHLNLLRVKEKITAYPERIALDVDKIERYLLNECQSEPIKLLHKYRAILERGSLVAIGDRIEQELIASGLVCLDKNVLKISQPHYQVAFDRDWVEQELARLQPYNQIRFKMFALNDKADIPYKIINAINYWTRQQPFLTQKIYQLIQERSSPIPSGEENTIVSELVYEKIIDNWETSIAASHFQEISDRIMTNESCSATILLKTYKKIWQLQEIPADDSIAQQELLKIGSIDQNQGRVFVSNPIYQAVFDRLWLEELLAKTPLKTTQADNKARVKSVELSPNSIRKKSSNSLAPSKIKIFSWASLLVIVASSFAIPLLVKTIAKPQQQDRNLERGNLFYAPQSDLPKVQTTVNLESV